MACTATSASTKALQNFSGKPTELDLLKPPFVQLFDLSQDPHEDKNLAAEQPQRVERMVLELKRQVASGRSTLGPPLKNDRNVKVVNLKDPRLPAVVRQRLQ